ncbi:hypothetical protein PIB30_071658 [Stylosanthes scabra]|uniref:GRF-type domain-containing protein n=1 Tax=Stylosanthes scabra TaxID=79078 RepID=A0ABU6RPN3_9FABA|nr:hypothetical protein [Stylosanthes scabra]
MAASREMRSRMTQSMDDGCSDGFTAQGRTTKPFDDTCYCRLGMIALKSKTKNDPNRWFYRCPKWKNKDGCCKYFQWMNEIQEKAVGVEECSANTNVVKEAEKLEIDSLTMKEHMKKVELLLFAIMAGVVIIVLMGLVSMVK